MPSLNKKIRKSLRLRMFPARIAEYSLEVGISAWGIYIGVNTLLVRPSSNALADLPNGLVYAWAGLMSIAAVTILTGVFVRPSQLAVSRGMYLVGATLMAYSAAVTAASGFAKGGAVSALLFVLGLVCGLRGWWLKTREAAFDKEMSRDSKGS